MKEWAKKELELIGAFDKESMYGGMVGFSVMELVELFVKQGHSGMSAGIVSSLFNKLAQYKPLSPLTLKDDEWSKFGDDDKYQNKRNSAVFKEGKDGRAYYSNAYYMKTQTCSTWHGSLSIDENTRIQRCYIKDPANMPTLCIDIIDWEVPHEGSGNWEHKVKELSQLDELKKYYDIEIVKR